MARPLYLTDEGSVIFVDEGRRYTTRNRDHLDIDEMVGFFGGDRSAFGEACRALGMKPIIEL